MDRTTRLRLQAPTRRDYGFGLRMDPPALAGARGAAGSGPLSRPDVGLPSPTAQRPATADDRSPRIVVAVRTLAARASDEDLSVPVEPGLINSRWTDSAAPRASRRAGKSRGKLVPQAAPSIAAQAACRADRDDREPRCPAGNSRSRAGSPGGRTVETTAGRLSSGYWLIVTPP